MKKKPLTFLLLALLSLAMPVFACVWDSDTIAAESRRGIAVGSTAKTDKLNVIIGKFERNPPLYYEMRLERVTKELVVDPSQLALYDDAGVACDRLGRSGDAIVWMERKREQMDQQPRNETQEYRYLANIGTFYAHRWISNGADFKNLQDLMIGRDYIEDAIELNPDAHFGREEFQLEAMRWMLSLSATSDSSDAPSSFHNANRRLRPESTPKNYRAVLGIGGLISLGTGWQSIDVYQALSNALYNNDDSVLAYLAMLRVKELQKGGKQSIALKLKGQVANATLDMNDEYLEDGRKAELHETYKKLRDAADSGHQQRTDFMMARLQEGMHPDTHPDFWEEYNEFKISSELFGQIPAIPVSQSSATSLDSSWVKLLKILGVISAVLLFFCLLMLRRHDMSRKINLTAG